MTKQLTELELDTMSLDDIRKLANDEAPNQEQDPATEIQPRDDKGRFAKPGHEQSQDEEDEPTVTVYRREIDLGDGSGKEVFEAPTLEELLDKIVEAKKHASKKIREQQQKLREIEEDKQQTTDDDEFVISQQLMAKPTEAFKKMFKQMTGVDISEFKTIAERSKALEVVQVQQAETQAQDEASRAFVAAHPEYIPNAANGKRLVKAASLLIGEAKAEGRTIDYGKIIEDAYADLTESGLLELKSAEEEQLGEVEPEAVTALPTQVRTPAPAATSAPARRQASSLSSRARAMTAPKSNGPSEDDLYNMPLDKLRELANTAR